MAEQSRAMLRDGKSDGFRVPKKKSECHKPKLNGTTITGTAKLLGALATHFNILAQSHASRPSPTNMPARI